MSEGIDCKDAACFMHDFDSKKKYASHSGCTCLIRLISDSKARAQIEERLHQLKHRSDLAKAAHGWVLAIYRTGWAVERYDTPENNYLINHLVNALNEEFGDE